MAKYMVRLTEEEPQQLLTLITTGRAAAAKLLHARILLKADARDGTGGWTDAEIAVAFDTRESTVHRVRQVWVEQDWEEALSRKRHTGWQYRRLDRAQKARLIALAYSAPPEGRTRWTLPLLADKLVTLEVVDTISAECVHATLKKTTSSRGNTNNG